MMVRQHVERKATPRRREQPDRDVERGPAGNGAGDVEELRDGLDDILDEIDALLEENAEEFVAAYVQKGGE